MTAAAVANFAQLEPGFSSEVGVLLKHGDRERDFIDDALAGAVPTGKQFEVPQRVVAPVSVNVMDGFLGEKLSPDVLLHDEAVFENVPRGLAVRPRNDHANVAIPDDALCGLGVGVQTLVMLSPESRAAFRAAKSLGKVKRSAGFPSCGESFPALDAGKDVLGFCVGAPAQSGAGDRAVRGVFPKFLPVFGQVCGFVGKWGSALFTCEDNRVHLRCGSAMDGLVLPSASAFAKSAGKLSPTGDSERFSAILAGKLCVGGFSLRFSAVKTAKALRALCGSYGKSRSTVFANFINGHGDVLSSVAVCIGWTVRMPLSIEIGV
jgi:hypothetical protein